VEKRAQKKTSCSSQYFFVYGSSQSRPQRSASRCCELPRS